MSSLGRTSILLKHGLVSVITLATIVLAAPSAARMVRAQAQVDPREVRAYDSRPEVREFIDEMVQRHGFDRSVLMNAFSRTRFQPVIVRAMEPQPRGVRSWQLYRSRFVHPKNIQDGTRFWAQHRLALERAAREYGVPAEIIVAIIGIETQFGRYTGEWRVLEALATLAFDFPRRSPYFRSELEHFLLYTRESRLDPNGLRGSFAGAVGIPQFMPSSYRRFAVDFDRDGRRDLLGSPVDAIGSVANFLREHGWKPGEAIAYRAAVEDDRHELLLAAGIEPLFRAAELPDYGVTVQVALDEDTPVALVELDTPNRPTVYYAGLANFYAITRYNQSSFYAISVFELAVAIRNEVQRLPPERD